MFLYADKLRVRGQLAETWYVDYFRLDFLLVIVAYLLGSLPTGYIAARYFKGIDIREHGSGSTGATNVLRVVGKGGARRVDNRFAQRDECCFVSIFGLYSISNSNIACRLASLVGRHRRFSSARRS